MTLDATIKSNLETGLNTTVGSQSKGDWLNAPIKVEDK